MHKNNGRWITVWLTRMNIICESNWALLFFFILSVFFLLVFSGTTSPLYSFEGADSAVFKSMGQAILEGKVLYRDIFDNKGPVLYLINALGQMIAGRIGIFILQSLGLFSTLFFLFKTARLFVRGTWALLSVVLSVLFLTVFFEGGNLCEEWMLYFFAPALYISMRWYCDLRRNEPLTFDRRRMIHDGFIYGIIFALTFFIRPNDAVGYVGGQCLAVAVLAVSLRKWRSLEFLGVSITLGIAVIAVPILLWFLANGALHDLWNGMIGINVGYVGGGAYILSLPVVKIPLLLCILTMCIVAYCHGGKKLLVMVACPLAMLFMLIGHTMFLHYYIVYIPYIFLGLCLAKNIHKPTALLGVLVLCLSQAMDSDGRYKPLARMVRHTIIGESRCKQWDHGQRPLLDEGERLVSHIPYHDRKSVWNDLSENYFAFPVFPHNGIVQYNRQIFDFGQNCVYKEFVFQQLDTAADLPLWVISTREPHDPLLSSDKSPYHWVQKTANYSLFHLKNTNIDTAMCHGLL